MGSRFVYNAESVLLCSHGFSWEYSTRLVAIFLLNIDNVTMSCDIRLSIVDIHRYNSQRNYMFCVKLNVDSIEIRWCFWNFDTIHIGSSVDL